MTLEDFKKVIDLFAKHSEKLRILDKNGVDLFHFSEDFWEVVGIFWDSLLTDAGKEWVEWFLMQTDYGRNNEIQAWDKDGNGICNTVEALYEYLTTNNYFKTQ